MFSRETREKEDERATYRGERKKPGKGSHRRETDHDFLPELRTRRQLGKKRREDGKRKAKETNKATHENTRENLTEHRPQHQLEEVDDLGF